MSNSDKLSKYDGDSSVFSISGPAWIKTKTQNQAIACEFDSHWVPHHYALVNIICFLSLTYSRGLFKKLMLTTLISSLESEDWAIPV